MDDDNVQTTTGSSLEIIENSLSEDPSINFIDPDLISSFPKPSGIEISRVIESATTEPPIISANQGIITGSPILEIKVTTTSPLTTSSPQKIQENPNPSPSKSRPFKALLKKADEFIGKNFDSLKKIFQIEK